MSKEFMCFFAVLTGHVSSLESLCQIHGADFGCESDVNLFFC